MTAFLIVLACLFLIVFLLLIVNINLVVTIEEEKNAVLKVLWFKWDVFELACKFSNDGGKTEEKEEKPKTRKRHRTPEEMIDVLSRLVKIFKAVLQEFCRYVKLKICNIYVKVACDDAAKTARLYGTASGAVAGLVELLSHFMTVKKREENIRVYPDFTSEECEVYFKIVLTTKPIYLLLAVSHLLPLVYKKKGR